MRVLQVVTHMNRGGLETMLMNYYRHIDRSKVQFDFLTHRENRCDYDDEIEILGGKIYRLPTLNPWSIKYRRALSDFFAKHSNYKVVHVHQDCMSSVILKEAAKHNIPMRIAHSHNSNQDKNIKYLVKLFYRHYIPRYATKLFACGEKAGKWMFRGANFEIMNNAIDSQMYVFNDAKRQEQRNYLKIDQTCILIGHVGRFSYAKNHSFLIDVFEKVCNKVEAKLLLVGDGQLCKQIKNKVNALNLSDRVIFTGVRDDVSDLMQAMDVFLFPSIYEGLPVTLIEAQASGLPCIISDKVPIECKKTDLVEQIALKEDAENWANEIIKFVQTKRRNTYDDIKNSGFDIRENAKKLQEFYLTTQKKEGNECLY